MASACSQKFLIKVILAGCAHSKYLPTTFAKVSISCSNQNRACQLTTWLTRMTGMTQPGSASPTKAMSLIVLNASPTFLLAAITSMTLSIDGHPATCHPKHSTRPKDSTSKCITKVTPVSLGLISASKCYRTLKPDTLLSSSHYP